MQSVYSYAQEFMIVEECGSQEEFRDEANSCSEVTLWHTGVFIVIYSTLYSTKVRENNKNNDSGIYTCGEIERTIRRVRSTIRRQHEAEIR